MGLAKVEVRSNTRGQEGAGQEVLRESEGGGEKRRRQEPPESKPRAKGQVEGRNSEQRADTCQLPKCACTSCSLSRRW